MIDVTILGCSDIRGTPSISVVRQDTRLPQRRARGKFVSKMSARVINTINFYIREQDMN